MSVTRLIVAGAKLECGRMLIPPSAAHHAMVARVGPGESVEVLNLAGDVGIATLSAWERGTCWVEVVRVVHGRGEPPAALALGLAVLQSNAFDWAVEKATELGVTTLVPVLCARVQRGSHAKRAPRWRRIAEAAVAQCGRSRAPEIAAPTELSAFAGQAAGVRYVADREAGVAAAVAVGASGVTVLVGPEGGFTDDERAAIARAGFVGLPLGPRVLRAETAAVTALTLAQSLVGWLR
jgi:16S rRNA (uracil1498-N3)-methyltransferase